MQRKVCGQLLTGQNRAVILFQPLKEKVPFTPSFEPDTLAGTSATVYLLPTSSVCAVGAV